jgi:O-antigen/teichoic acid export membrane protein
VIALGLALAWILGGLLAREAFMEFAHVGSGWRVEARAATGTTIFAAAVGLLALVPGAALTGVHRLDLANRVTVLGTLVQVAATLVSIANGAGLPGLALALLLGNATTLAGSLFVLRRVAPELTLDFAAVSRPRAVEQLRFSAALQVIALGGLLQYQLPKFVLARGVGLAAAGEFELAYRVAFSAWSLPSLVLPPLLPALAEWTAQGRWEDAWNLYERAARYLLVLALPMAALLATSAPALYLAWLGPGHMNAAVSLFAIAALLGVNVLTSAGCLFVRATGRPWIEARYQLVAFAVQVALAAWLVPRMHLGGALIAMFVSGSVGTMVFLWTFHRAFGRSLQAFVVKLAMPPALVSSAGAGLAFAVSGAIAAGGWGGARARALASLALGNLAGVGAMVVGALWLGYVSRAELAEIMRRVPSAVRWR